jgi:hypothetical protein
MITKIAMPCDAIIFGGIVGAIIFRAVDAIIFVVDAIIFRGCYHLSWMLLSSVCNSHRQLTPAFDKPGLCKRGELPDDHKR